MAQEIQVSAIIPTYNRRDLVQRAIESVLAQTLPVDEIVVIDDGSDDGTEDILRTRYGERIRYYWQGNSGVSVARNRGFSLARGRYLAMLDSDDIWLPEKNRKQIEFLDTHQDFGMVVCDVTRIGPDGAEIDIFKRREVTPHDGWVLDALLMNPSLVPASAMVRREAWASVGGFDPTLTTAEDIDFHLRLARRWKIGVIDQVLTYAMRGREDGLSGEANTYDDYVHVVERAVADSAGEIDALIGQRALAATYVRNARGMMISSRWTDAWQLARKALRTAPDSDSRSQVLALLPFAARRMLATALRR